MYDHLGKSAKMWAAGNSKFEATAWWEIAGFWLTEPLAVAQWFDVRAEYWLVVDCEIVAAESVQKALNWGSQHVAGFRSLD